MRMLWVLSRLDPGGGLGKSGCGVGFIGGTKIPVSGCNAFLVIFLGEYHGDILEM